MSTTYRIKAGDTETCQTCGGTFEGGDHMIRLTALGGERLGSCCWDCYDDEQEDIWS
jgi:hypothetical protein